MIEKIIIFVVFLCPLIFFHELGHFLFARLFGVRVETFSIGFGPKLAKFKWGDTEYTISLIPLGGYVKMFGDDPYKEDDIPENEKKCAFNYKGKWARFWIVFGGPLANFILAYFIFFGILLSGEKTIQPQFGVLSEESRFFQEGIRPGDILYKINNEEVFNIMDLGLSESDMIQTITVKNANGTKEIQLNEKVKDFLEELFKYPPHFRYPIVMDTRGNFYAISGDEKSFEFTLSLEELSYQHSDKIFMYRLKNPWVSSDENKRNIDVEEETKREISVGKKFGENFYQLLVKQGFYALDLKVLKILENSPAEKAGLRAEDLIVSIDNQKLLSFAHLRESLQKMKKGRSAFIQYYRNGNLHTVKIHPESVKEGNEDVLKVGVYSSIDFLPMRYVISESKGFFSSIYLSFGRTWDAFYKTVVGFKKLVSNEVPLKSVGGPIAIGKVASDSFSIGLSYFFKIMAIISVNLGVINLFPIPVLDGGHIFFIIIETLNRGPVSRKKMEIAQQVGLSLLLVLIFAALYNDLSKIFDF